MPDTTEKPKKTPSRPGSQWATGKRRAGSRLLLVRVAQSGEQSALRPWSVGRRPSALLPDVDIKGEAFLL
jgi:hypothetical protein